MSDEVILGDYMRRRISNSLFSLEPQNLESGSISNEVWFLEKLRNSSHTISIKKMTNG